MRDGRRRNAGFFDDAEDWVCNANDEFQERFDVSVDKCRKKEDEIGRPVAYSGEDGFQMVYGKKKIPIRSVIKKPLEEDDMYANQPLEHVELERSEDGQLFMHPLVSLLHSQNICLHVLNCEAFESVAQSFKIVSPGPVIDYHIEPITERKDMYLHTEDSLQVESNIAGLITVKAGFTPSSSSVVEDPFMDGYISDKDFEIFQKPHKTAMVVPSRTAILDMLPADLRSRLKTEVTTTITSEWAKRVLGDERFKLVLETKPVSFLRLSDSSGKMCVVWRTGGLPACYILSDKTSTILIDATGFIRDQKGHKLCWGYALTDLISASRVLQGCDLKFTPLCTQYLCEHVNPTAFKRTLVSKDDGHSCYAANFSEGVSYIKLHGIPKERPGHEKYMCGEKRPSVKDKEMFLIDNIYEYHTLEQALVRLKNHPVVATIPMFDGWTDRKIYRGPLREGAKFVDTHLVIIVDCKKIDGEMIAICKSSNGQGVGFEGYIYVSLEVMFIMAGATRKAGKYNFCHIEPQHLLFDFFSVDVKRGSYEPKIQEDPRKVQDNSFFKVDLNYYNLAPRQKARSYLGIVGYSQNSCSLVGAPLTDSDSTTYEETSAIDQPSVARVKMMKARASDFSTAEIQGECSELRQTAGSSSTFVIQAQPYLNAIPMPLRLEVICLKACTHYPTLFDHFQRNLHDVFKDLKRKKILENWKESEPWKLLKEIANSAHYQEGAHRNSQPKPVQGIFGMDSEKVKAIHARIDEFTGHMSQLLQVEMEVTQKDLDVIPARDW